VSQGDQSAPAASTGPSLPSLVLPLTEYGYGPRVFPFDVFRWASFRILHYSHYDVTVQSSIATCIIVRARIDSVCCINCLLKELSLARLWILNTFNAVLRPAGCVAKLR